MFPLLNSSTCELGKSLGVTNFDILLFCKSNSINLFLRFYDSSLGNGVGQLKTA
jgi:hypothetical protein